MLGRQSLAQQKVMTWIGFAIAGGEDGEENASETQMSA